MKSKKSLTASSQNYLKAIYHIVMAKKAARTKDIAQYTGLGASSVSEVLKILADKELINYEPYGIITLTDEGEEVAKDLIRRHEIIRNYFENVLMVSPELSEESAAKVQHAIPDEVLKKFVMFLTFMETCSCKEPKWIKSFKHYSQNGQLSEKCQNCICNKKDNPELSNKNCCGMSV
ncbi:MAG: metal-dependent transcriptional regulator [Candidatus Gastranaerophilales bacterium]|jgi:DtxR family Mn-dependent transcriptional regulator|nr:metal-dependent transcriptional regulator [Candidatus Gastranaerophilales bacterium]